ncbi:MAG: RodZ domain-containing protein [Acidobacteriota bacterium]
MKKKRRKDAEDSAPVVDKPTSEAKSFGPWLRRQREGRDIELRDIAQASKISLRYLDALENNRFEALPAELFTKGFLRQYASFVGLDAEEVVNYYLAAKSEADAEKADEVPEELRLDRRRSSSGLPLVLGAILLLGLIATAVWWFTQRPSADTGADAAVPTSTLNEAGPSTPSPRPAASAPAPVPQDSAPAATSESSTAPAQRDSEPAPNSDASDGAEPAAGDVTETAAATPPRPPTRVAGAVTGAPLELVLDFNADCWIEASIDGQSRVAEMRVQGESIRLSGQEILEVMVGDISAVDMELNGRAWQPPGSSAPVRRFRVDLESSGGSANSTPSTGGAP